MTQWGKTHLWCRGEDERRVREVWRQPRNQAAEAPAAVTPPVEQDERAAVLRLRWHDYGRWLRGGSHGNDSGQLPLTPCPAAPTG